MAEASILSSKPKLKDINKYCELDDKWYSLGIELEMNDKELDDLEQRYSDPHRRLIKMFGVWLEKGENPTYRKLLKALVNIHAKDIAQSLCADLGKYIDYYCTISLEILVRIKKIGSWVQNCLCKCLADLNLAVQ